MKNVHVNNSNRECTMVKGIFLLLLFAAITLTIYSNTFYSPFVFDDKRNISENPNIRMEKLSFDALVKASEGLSDNRPFPMITFAFNYFFHRYSLSGYHIVNIFIHIINSIFLFCFIATTIKLSNDSDSENENRKTIILISFFATILWMVNPLQTNSVTYIVQRMNSMATMFYLLSLLCYIKGRLLQKINLTSGEAIQSNWRLNHSSFIGLNDKPHIWFILSVVFFIFALGCKQTAASLPLFIFLYEFYFFQKLKKDWLKKSLRYLAGIFLLISLVAVIYLGSNPIQRLSSLTDFSNNEFTYLERVLTQPRVVIYYLQLIFFPHYSILNFDHDFPLSHSLTDPLTTIYSLCLIIFLIVFSLFISEKKIT